MVSSSFLSWLLERMELQRTSTLRQRKSSSTLWTLWRMLSPWRKAWRWICSRQFSNYNQDWDMAMILPFTSWELKLFLLFIWTHRSSEIWLLQFKNQDTQFCLYKYIKLSIEFSTLQNPLGKYLSITYTSRNLSRTLVKSWFWTRNDVLYTFSHIFGPGRALYVLQHPIVTV